MPTLGKTTRKLGQEKRFSGDLCTKSYIIANVQLFEDGAPIIFSGLAGIGVSCWRAHTLYFETFNVVRPKTVGTRSLKVSFQKYCFRETAEDSRTDAVGKKGRCLFFLTFQTDAGGAICFFALHIVNTLKKKQLARKYSRPSNST